MFILKINDEIKLSLVQKSFAKIYVDLLKKDYDNLEQWLAWPPNCKTEQDFMKFIQMSLHDYADGKSMVCAILFNDKIVGNISFNSIDYKLKKVKIGYWLSSSAQGQGIITISSKKLIDIAFNELKMQKIEISVATKNRQSRAVCERLGMSLEGIIRNCENLNGRIVDHAIYSLYQE